MAKPTPKADQLRALTAAKHAKRKPVTAPTRRKPAPPSQRVEQK